MFPHHSNNWVTAVYWRIWFIQKKASQIKNWSPGPLCFVCNFQTSQLNYIHKKNCHWLGQENNFCFWSPNQPQVFGTGTELLFVNGLTLSPDRSDVIISFIKNVTSKLEMCLKGHRCPRWGQTQKLATPFTLHTKRT